MLNSIVDIGEALKSASGAQNSWYAPNTPFRGTGAAQLSARVLGVELVTEKEVGGGGAGEGENDRRVLEQN